MLGYYIVSEIRRFAKVNEADITEQRSPGLFWDIYTRAALIYQYINAAFETYQFHVFWAQGSAQCGGSGEREFAHTSDTIHHYLSDLSRLGVARRKSFTSTTIVHSFYD